MFMQHNMQHTPLYTLSHTTLRACTCTQCKDVRKRVVVVAISGSTPIVDITGTRSGRSDGKDLETQELSVMFAYNSSIFHLLICKPYDSLSLDYCMSVYNFRLDNCNYFLNMFVCYLKIIVKEFNQISLDLFKYPCQSIFI